MIKFCMIFGNKNEVLSYYKRRLYNRILTYSSAKLHFENIYFKYYFSLFNDMLRHSPIKYDQEHFTLIFLNYLSHPNTLLNKLIIHTYSERVILERELIAILTDHLKLHTILRYDSNSLEIENYCKHHSKHIHTEPFYSNSLYKEIVDNYTTDLIKMCDGHNTDTPSMDSKFKKTALKNTFDEIRSFFNNEFEVEEFISKLLQKEQIDTQLELISEELVTFEKLFKDIFDSKRNGYLINKEHYLSFLIDDKIELVDNVYIFSDLYYALITAFKIELYFRCMSIVKRRLNTAIKNEIDENSKYKYKLYQELLDNTNKNITYIPTMVLGYILGFGPNETKNLCDNYYSEKSAKRYPIKQDEFDQNYIKFTDILFNRIKTDNLIYFVENNSHIKSLKFTNESSKTYEDIHKNFTEYVIYFLIKNDIITIDDHLDVLSINLNCIDCDKLKQQLLDNQIMLKKLVENKITILNQFDTIDTC